MQRDRQLPFEFHRHDAATFASFIAGPNAEAVEALKRCSRVAAGEFVYLWGTPGSGRSHLLQAVCEAAAAASRAVACLSLREIGQLTPSLCEGLENLDPVCVDDIDAIAGNADWERALLALYNALRDRGHTLVVAAGTSPRDSAVSLPDLKSRLSWGLVVQLRPLGDDDKRVVLKTRAARRGIDLTEDVLDYMLNRVQRDLAALCGLLDRIDVASLAAQRRVTVPFIRALMGG